ncbi:MAG TPA: adenylate/guanylate cyclase domain-containing protein [Chitinophagaceae bacterium]
MHRRGKAYGVAASLLCLLTFGAAAQNQRVADSLARIYRTWSGADSAKMELLRNLAFNEVNDLALALKYAEELVSLARQQGNNLYLYRGYLQVGNKKTRLGDLDEALDAYFRSADAARKTSFLPGEGSAYGAIADIYSVSGNHPNARHYYRKAIATLRRTSDSISLASVISNAGDEFLKRRDYDSALLHFKEAGRIFARLNHETGKAYSMGNMGMVYANTGRKALAEIYMNEAIRAHEKAGDYYPICIYLLSMTDIYVEKGDLQTALAYAHRSAALARQHGLKEQIRDASQKLSQLYERSGNPAGSLQYFKDYVAYRDSVNDIRAVQKMADMRTNFEIAQKQSELDLLNKENENQQIVARSLGIILIMTIFILGTLYWYFRTISREKRRSEGLLLNILPAETAKELKRNGVVEAVKVEGVTVLFTDFVGFSRLAEEVEPEQLVKSLDFYFRGFDAITTKWGLEKIKTIGDSYMCACGLHTPNEAHARNVINTAREMVDLANKELAAEDGLIHFEVRIGIHTGPVVAGIVGTKKWQFDIWGDTVNIASRMESMSEKGRINLSETTYQLIKDEFTCEYRGEIDVKNHRRLKMYFLADKSSSAPDDATPGRVKVIQTGLKEQDREEDWHPPVLSDYID